MTVERMAKWQQRFIKSLRAVPNVKVACKAAGINRWTAYRHRKDNPQFAALWQDALDQSIDELEGRAFEIALHGDQQSHATCQLITWLLRCHKPETYADTQRHELLGGIVLIPAKARGDE